MSNWCVVATPFPSQRRSFREEGKEDPTCIRREKGLGRLSVARLGDRLEMTTRTKERGVRTRRCGVKRESSLDVQPKWMSVRPKSPIRRKTRTMVASGTRLRIFDLRSEWGAGTASTSSMIIYPGSCHPSLMWMILKSGCTETRGSSFRLPRSKCSFLNRPKYRLTGHFTKNGDLSVEYAYAPLGTERKARSTKRKVSWNEIREQTRVRALKKLEKPSLRRI